MEPIYEHRPELGGADTRALELDGEGPRLILLHGFADSADTWRLLLDRLRRLGRAAVALDLPGFGAASRLDPDEPILSQLDRFVEGAVRRYSRGGQVAIAGNSLGGTLALRAAQRDELPVAGVIPIAPAGLDMAGWFLIIEREPLIQAILRSPFPIPRIAIRQAVSRIYRFLAFADRTRIDAGVVAAFGSHIQTREDVVRLHGTGRRLLPEIRDPFELGRIDCPVLLVWGDRDRLVYSTGSDRVLREVPGSRIEVLERCGHCPQVEVPDRLAELIERFVASSSRGPTPARA
jgi:pimeloyl-ACP methyl ester carboxylesterase